MELSKEYQKALEVSEIAIKAYKLVVADYRSRKVGDNELFAAQDAYKLAMAEFDKAYAKEAY